LSNSGPFGVHDCRSSTRDLTDSLTTRILFVGHVRLAPTSYPPGAMCSHAHPRLHSNNSPNCPQSILINMADPKFLSYVDEHQEQFIDRLAEAVAIPS